MHLVGRFDGCPSRCLQQRLQIAGFEGVVVLCKFKHLLCHRFWVGGGVIFEVELDFLDGFGEHEVVLGHSNFLALGVPPESLVDQDDFLEVQFLEVDVHPAHEEVDQVALLQLVVAHAAQCLEHFGELAIEVVESVHSLQALSVLLHKLHAASH